MGITKSEQFEVNFQEDIKRLLATNLTAKGQPSVGTESLTALVKKVANVNTGRKWATGTATRDGTGRLIVNGLDFRPSVVMVRTNNTDAKQVGFLFEKSLMNWIAPNPYPTITGVSVYGSGDYNASAYYLSTGGSPSDIHSSGFWMTVEYQGRNYTWIAFE